MSSHERGQQKFADFEERQRWYYDVGDMEIDDTVDRECRDDDLLESGFLILLTRCKCLQMFMTRYVRDLDFIAI